MNEINIPQETLEQIKAVQEKNQIILIELGQIEIQKTALKQRKLVAKQYLLELQQEEKTLGEFLEHQYGNGTIDLEKGTFTTSN